jgi:hypothetical protein
MKTLKIFLSLALLSFIGYLISCDVVEPDKNKIINNTDFLSDCNTPADKCAIPTYCDSGKGEHFCLYLYNGDTDTEFNYSSIYRVIVTHTGVDCDSISYYCRYISGGSNPTGLGCVLPWCSSNCRYIRSVCLLTTDNKTYEGSVTFGYSNYSGCRDTVYQTDGECDFGGIEKIYNQD